ncbi:hypothetical protein CANINC_000867 [Pichia inconspicua]|uniref:Amidohydrolase-related domain-containing protein n=1 Tax=Pichia inconspicua TaxID=52247 RepID=A0A4T0X6N8_9ASCO|nr:hypothetical protein CANINC_000867 [[Candida] inconspicua]
MRYDSHCHLSPEINEKLYHDSVREYLRIKDFPINLMMTNHIDENIIRLILQDDNILENECIRLNVGIHPWFSHLYTFLKKYVGETSESFKKRHYESVLEKYSKKINSSIDALLEVLPEPIPISKKIAEFNKLISLSFGNRINIGEIGLDKFARIPLSGYLCNPVVSTTGLSNYKVTMSHQIQIFEQFLELAIQFNKSCSIHCVGGYGLMYDIIKQSKVTRIVMHSYSGSVDSALMLRKLPGKNVWFGISDFVNFCNGISDKVKELIPLISDRILVETDFGIDKMGNDHFEYVDEVITKLSKVGIDLDNLWQNWLLFCDGEDKNNNPGYKTYTQSYK